MVDTGFDKRLKIVQKKVRPYLKQALKLSANKRRMWLSGDWSYGDTINRTIHYLRPQADYCTAYTGCALMIATIKKRSIYTNDITQVTCKNCLRYYYKKEER